MKAYNKFAVGSSDGEISRDNSVLSHISVDFQVDGCLATRLPMCKVQPTRKGRGFPILSKGPKLSKTITPLQATTDGQRQIQTNTHQGKDEDSDIHEIVLTQSCSPSRPSPDSQTCRERLSSPTRGAHHEARTSTTDELSTMFASLVLKTLPESSTSTSQPPLPTADPNLKVISPTIKSYLNPILRCKNVTQDVSEFSSWMVSRTHLALEKIGEGSFGEVFRALSPNGETVILKLMPLNAMKGRGSKSFTSINNAANEIRLLKRMQRIPGFVEFRGACVLIGSLPETIVDLWKEYKSSGRTVESRDPSKKTSYATDQLWLLIEMSDAGHNLEPGQYALPGEISVKGQRYLGIGRAWDIFWEVVKSIAKAECWVQFEHRDLHMGNICARDTIHTADEEDLTLVSNTEPTPLPINTSKLEITIIDYSLSRAYMENEDNVLFYDFKKDKDLLNGKGDLQYDMYRYMAAAVGNRSCKEFVPQTNVVWLWYVLDRILAVTKPLSPEAKTKKQGLITREARKLDILTEVQDLIKPESMVDWTIDSAGALLAIGIDQSWLLVDDVTN